jgi:hypothetical protein
MSWFNAGTDQKETVPDLFGCVELPIPAHCFGDAEATYSEEHRVALLQYLKDEMSQTKPWPKILKSCISNTVTNSVKITSSCPIFGSPVLDYALGRVNALSNVFEDMNYGGLNEDSDAGKLADPANLDNSQFDANLPPEAPTEWVQCEKCHNWRRLNWDVDSSSLPDLW